MDARARPPPDRGVQTARCGVGQNSERGELLVVWGHLQLGRARNCFGGVYYFSDLKSESDIPTTPPPLQPITPPPYHRITPPQQSGLDWATKRTCRARVMKLAATDGGVAPTGGGGGDGGGGGGGDGTDTGTGAPDPSKWFPINRRRKAWSGWHIDIGTGFPPQSMRTMAGQKEQVGS